MVGALLMLRESFERRAVVSTDRDLKIARILEDFPNHCRRCYQSVLSIVTRVLETMKSLGFEFSGPLDAAATELIATLHDLEDSEFSESVSLLAYTNWFSTKAERCLELFRMLDDFNYYSAAVRIIGEGLLGDQFRCGDHKIV
jgi:hypothetical protein